ncbi:MAG: DUF4344 domain-containing metallopeptidase [Synechococcaceae cyanobacterium RL_1_2]|nr:DUF4344 domain-containing metallopeptidase [Synechococcaceae cyanobacterium RL_1_2]
MFLVIPLGGCSTEETTAQTIEDTGDLRLTYETTDNENFEKIREVLETTQFFDELMEDLNNSLVFTEDIDVIFTTCDESNAYYDGESSTITMCYELVDDYVAIFADEVETEEDFANEVIDATSFTFFHELGHGLIAQYQLPITGNEEDAVDNFAAIVLLDLYEDDLGAISGMFQFEADAEEETEIEDLAFWDEHALSSQRYYNTACLIYGSDPKEFAYLVEEEYLPAERAELCEEEYAQKSDAWWALLDPYLK